MKMVNPVLLAFFLATSACSGQTVPEKDAAIQSLNAGDIAGARIHIKNALAANPKDPELHFISARIALEDGNVDLAKSELQPLLGNPKFGKEARAMLGQAHVIAGNPQIALETINAGPLDSGLAYAVAVDANLALGHPVKDLLAKGLAAFPESSELLQVDALLAISTGDMPRARANSTKILALAPKDAHGLLLAGRIALIDSDKASAEKYFDAALALNKNNQVALLAKAALAHDRGDIKTANAFLAQSAKNASGGSLQTRAFMAQMALEAGDVAGANKIMDSLPAQSKMPYIAMLRGIIAGARGQSEQAISLLQPFLNQGGENPAARVALSNAYAATGDKRQAWAVLKPLADLANASPSVLELAAQLSGALQLPDAAQYRARQQAATRPDPIAKDMAEADKAIGAGDWKGADAIYQRLLGGQGANNVILLNNAANVRLQLGDTAQAAALARRAQAAAPNDPIVADTLGWILFKQAGATPEVVELMRKAYAGQPGNPEVREHLTQISRTLKTAE